MTPLALLLLLVVLFSVAILSYGTVLLYVNAKKKRAKIKLGSQVQRIQKMNMINWSQLHKVSVDRAVLGHNEWSKKVFGQVVHADAIFPDRHPANYANLLFHYVKEDNNVHLVYTQEYPYVLTFPIIDLSKIEFYYTFRTNYDVIEGVTPQQFAENILLHFLHASIREQCTERDLGFSEEIAWNDFVIIAGILKNCYSDYPYVIDFHYIRYPEYTDRYMKLCAMQEASQPVKMREDLFLSRREIELEGE